MGIDEWLSLLLNFGGCFGFVLILQRRIRLMYIVHYVNHFGHLFLINTSTRIHLWHTSNWNEIFQQKFSWTVVGMCWHFMSAVESQVYLLACCWNVLECACSKYMLLVECLNVLQQQSCKVENICNGSILNVLVCMKALICPCNNVVWLCHC